MIKADIKSGNAVSKSQQVALSSVYCTSQTHLSNVSDFILGVDECIIPKGNSMQANVF